MGFTSRLAVLVMLAVPAGAAAGAGGRVGGMVVTEQGKPAAGIEVELVPAADIRSPVSHATTTVDAGGRFTFDRVAQGRYVLAVNRLRRIEPAVLYPTWFVPGTPDPAVARVFAVASGSHVQAGTLRLQAPLPQRAFGGVVVWPGGAPVAGAFVSLTDSVAGHQQVSDVLRTGADGRFTFVVHDGLQYVVRAMFLVSRGATYDQVVAIAGPFVSTPALTSVQIVMPR